MASRERFRIYNAGFRGRTSIARRVSPHSIPTVCPRASSRFCDRLAHPAPGCPEHAECNQSDGKEASPGEELKACVRRSHCDDWACAATSGTAEPLGNRQLGTSHPRTAVSRQGHRQGHGSRGRAQPEWARRAVRPDGSNIGWLWPLDKAFATRVSVAHGYGAEQHKKPHWAVRRSQQPSREALI